jgi:hypothetical protein
MNTWRVKRPCPIVRVAGLVVRYAKFTIAPADVAFADILSPPCNLLSVRARISVTATARRTGLADHSGWWLFPHVSALARFGRWRKPPAVHRTE